MCKCDSSIKFGDYSRMDVIITKDGKKNKCG